MEMNERASGNRLRIGELAHLAGTTTRAVRHYHANGLLAEPDRDDSGYRRYGAEHPVGLIRIRRLRSLGMPLDQIAARPTMEEEGAVAVPVEGAVDHAVPVLEAFFDGRFDEVRSRFAPRMLAAVSAELLADVREKVRERAGEVQALGTPVVSVRDGFTVVDIPVALEHADGIGRVVLDADREVAGFFVRPREDVG
jgi:DNA-binding transcriptional MerR regulator